MRLIRQLTGIFVQVAYSAATSKGPSQPAARKNQSGDSRKKAFLFSFLPLHSQIFARDFSRFGIAFDLGYHICDKVHASGIVLFFHFFVEFT